MSKPSPQHPDIMGGPPLSARVAYEEWLAHVEAGRIGTRVKQSPEILRRHVQNELVVLGYRTFPLDDD